MPRNNKRKKKLSNFKKFLCIYCGILLLAGVITLIMLHSLLKDYEEGMPSGTMDKIVNQFTPDGIGKLLSDNNVKVNEFETNDTIAAYFTDKLNDGCGRHIQMNIREEQEKREHLIFSPYASFSDESRGRDRDEEPCPMRTIYQRDRDRIIHCKTFRRLKHKTQVFLAPEGDHYRTRLTHTLEVAQIARSIARALNLNEDLTEAIALGHDLGHTPFGHAGERTLNSLCPMGFAHYKQSIRVVEFLEKDGQGLNLTWEVRDGILNHRTSGNPSTLEGKAVRLSDKIAYINHDIDDGIRAGILKESDIPSEYTDVLGNSTKERLNTMISDIIMNSIGKNDLVMSEPVRKAMTELRKFMFESLYLNPTAKSEEAKADKLITELYRYYVANTDKLPDTYKRFITEFDERPEQVVCDYIAGMSDQYSISKFQEIFVPKAWKG